MEERVPSICVSIANRTKQRTGRVIDPKKIKRGMGCEAYNKMVGEKKANVCDPKNNTLKGTEVRYIACKTDLDNPAYQIHFAGHKTCRKCGKELDIIDINRGNLLCPDCSDAQRKEKQKQKILEEARIEQQKKVEENSVTIPRLNSAPLVDVLPADIPSPSSVLKLMTEEEMKNHYCHVKTVNELREHSPNRSVNYITIQNYNVFTFPQNNDVK